MASCDTTGRKPYNSSRTRIPVGVNSFLTKKQTANAHSKRFLGSASAACLEILVNLLFQKFSI